MNKLLLPLGALLLLVGKKKTAPKPGTPRAASSPAPRSTPEAHVDQAPRPQAKPSQASAPRPAAAPRPEPAHSEAPAKPVYAIVNFDAQEGRDRTGDEQPIGTRVALGVSKPKSMESGHIWVKITSVDYNVFNAYKSKYEGLVLIAPPWLPGLVGKTVQFRQNEIYVVESDKYRVRSWNSL